MARPVIVLRNLLVMAACVIAGAAGMRFAINYLPEGPDARNRPAAKPAKDGATGAQTPETPIPYEFAPWHEYSLALSDTIGPGLPEPRDSWLAPAVAVLPPRTPPLAERPLPRAAVAVAEISFMDLRAGESPAEPPQPVRMAVVLMAPTAVRDAGNVADFKLRGRFDPDRPTPNADPTFDAWDRMVTARPADLPRPQVPPVVLTIPDPFATAADHAIRQTPPDDEPPVESTAAPPRPVLPDKP